MQKYGFDCGFSTFWRDANRSLGDPGRTDRDESWAGPGPGRAGRRPARCPPRPHVVHGHPPGRKQNVSRSRGASHTTFVIWESQCSRVWRLRCLGGVRGAFSYFRGHQTLSEPVPRALRFHILRFSVFPYRYKVYSTSLKCKKTDLRKPAFS